MRQEYPLYIVTLFVITLSTLNLYLLSNNIQQINNYQSEESSNNNNNNEWQQYLMDSEEQWNNNNNNNNKQIYKDIKRDKVELARMSRPTTSLPLSSNKLKQQEENISNTNIIKSPLLTNNNNNNNSNNSNNNSNNNNNNIPTFPPIYSTCDTFYQHYFNQSYNTEYLSDNLITHKYKVSICTRVKNEAKYVQEWLLYNWLILRVSHFYVYDDNSSDNLLQVLQPFIDRGIIYWDNNRTVAEELVAKEPQFTRGQRFSIADCTTKYKIHSEWMAFWDIDEFVYLPEGHLDTHVKERRWDNILIPWAIFGSSNHTDIQPGLVINNYRWRIPLLQFGVTKAEGKYYGKVLYKTKCIPLAAVHLEDMTSSRCVLGDYPVRLDHDVEGYPIHMKHYWSKSYEDYTSKLLKWQNAHWIQKEYNQLTQNKFDKMMEEETMNSKYDVDMLVYVDMLRYSIDCVNKL